MHTIDSRERKSTTSADNAFVSAIKSGFFIDNTLLIKEMLQDGAKIKLITRPSGFGKSFNLNMIHSYFSNQLNHKEHFQDLKIFQEENIFTSAQGKYPVIFINLSSVQAENYERALKEYRRVLSQIYLEFKEPILEIVRNVEYEEKYVKKIIAAQGSTSETMVGIQKLTEYLCNYYHEKVIILIDEYEVPLNKSYENNYFPQLSSFLQDVLRPVFKNNAALYQAILVGVNTFITESVFSSLNNVTPYNIFSKRYSDYFGFFLEEIGDAIESFLSLKKIKLENISIEKILDKLDSNYGGHQFGDNVLVNPSAVIEFLHGLEKRVVEFPLWTISPVEHAVIVNGYLESKNTLSIKEGIIVLSEDGILRQAVNESSDLLNLNSGETDFWTYLLMHGCLSYQSQKYSKKGRICELVVPNSDLREFYKKLSELNLKEVTLGKKGNKRTIPKTSGVEQTVIYSQYTADFDEKSSLEPNQLSQLGTKEAKKIEGKQKVISIINGTVNIKQKYTGMNYTGSAADFLILSPLPIQIFNDARQEAGAKISKQVIARGTQVNQPVSVNQESRSLTLKLAGQEAEVFAPTSLEEIMAITKVTAVALVNDFNTVTDLEKKQYLKTIMNDAIAIFTTRYAQSAPPESMIDEVLELANAQDEELYRSCVSALSVVLTNPLLSSYKPLHGLTCILRNPGKNYKLSHNEIDSLLVLALSKISTDAVDAVTLQALNNLLDAMVERQSLIVPHEKKEAIKKQLNQVITNAKSRDNYAAIFQLEVALKTLERIDIDETLEEEWKRRALAFASAIESLLIIAADVSNAVASQGATAAFIIPEVITESRKAIKKFVQAFNLEIPGNEWYAKIKDIQIILAAAAIEKHAGLEDVLAYGELQSLFTKLTTCITAKKHKLPHLIQYAIVDSLEKLLIVRSDEDILKSGLELLYACYNANCPRKKKPTADNHAIQIKVIEVLLTIQRCYSDKQANEYLEIIKKLNEGTYNNSFRVAESNLKTKLAKSPTTEVLATLVLKAKKRLEKLIADNKEEKDVVIPLIGNNAIIRAPVDINQQYTGTKLIGTVEDIIRFIENDRLRSILERDCAAARSVISEQVIGTSVQIWAKFNVNQVSTAPEMNLTAGGATNVPASMPQQTLTLTEKFRELIDTSLDKKSGYVFELNRIINTSMNCLTITLKNSNDSLRKQGMQLGHLQRELELCLNNVNPKPELNNNDDEGVLTITAEKHVINAIVDLLVRQGLSWRPSEVKKYSTFFNGELPVQAQATTTTIKQPEEETIISCAMQ